MAHNQEVCTINSKNIFSLFYCYWQAMSTTMHCLWRKGMSLGLDGMPRLLNK